MSIKDMASSHLLNAIHLIERTRLTQLLEFSMRFDIEMDIDRDMLRYYSQWPLAYDALIDEAERRRLIHRSRPSATTKSLARKGRARP